jgi:hypothetical protein
MQVNVSFFLLHFSFFIFPSYFILLHLTFFLFFLFFLTHDANNHLKRRKDLTWSSSLSQTLVPNWPNLPPSYSCVAQRKLQLRPSHSPKELFSPPPQVRVTKWIYHLIIVHLNKTVFITKTVEDRWLILSYLNVTPTFPNNHLISPQINTIKQAPRNTASAMCTLSPRERCR